MPRRTLGFLFVIVAILAVPALSFGQWLKYPTDGVPRTADGKPDMNALSAATAGRQAGLLGTLACQQPQSVRSRAAVSSSNAGPRLAGRCSAATSGGT